MSLGALNRLPSNRSTRTSIRPLRSVRVTRRALYSHEVQASLPIHRVAVGPVGAFPIDFGRLSRNVFVDPVLTVVAEEEKPFARPHRPFAAFEAGGHLLHLQLREVLGGQGCRNREQEDDCSEHRMSPSRVIAD